METIYHEEGRAVSDGSGEFEYQFRLTDHLGNTRVMFADLNSDGEVTEEEIIQENHYYPGGLEMEGEWTNATVPLQPYMYSNKEYNGDFDLDLLDYGARYFDPSKVVWNQIDVLASDYVSWSPYNFVFNNPIKYFDPDGKNGILAIDKNAGTINVKVDLHFSPKSGETLASKGIANKFVSNNSFEERIHYNWSKTYTVKIDEKEYKVSYEVNIITHDTHEEAVSAWKEDATSNLLFVSEGTTNNSTYGAEKGILTLNSNQQINGDKKTFDHEVGHALGIGHNNYKNEKGVFSISSYKTHKRNVINQDVLNTVNGAIKLANTVNKNNVNIVLKTGTYINTVTVQNSDGTSGESSTYPVPDQQK